MSISPKRLLVSPGSVLSCFVIGSLNQNNQKPKKPKGTGTFAYGKLCVSNVAIKILRLHFVTLRMTGGLMKCYAQDTGGLKKCYAQDTGELLIH